jgi:hypothetical protein
MAGSIFDDFFSVMPFFLLFVGIGFSSLALSLYPQLTVAAIVVNLVLGVYYLFRGYSANEDKMKIDDIALNGFHKFIGWILTLSAIALGIKFIFLGYKSLPIFGHLLLSKKNLNTKSNTV